MGGFRLLLLVRPLIVALRGHFVLVFLEQGFSGCGAVSRKHGVKKDCKSCVVGDLRASCGTCFDSFVVLRLRRRKEREKGQGGKKRREEGDRRMREEESP